MQSKNLTVVNYVSRKVIHRDPDTVNLTRHLFATNTFDTKEFTRDECWNQLSKMNNRWVQKLRRLSISKNLISNTKGLQYIRTIEEHKSGYPHAHWLFQFDRPVVKWSYNRDPNKNYFYIHDIYQDLRATWDYNADFQVPKSSSNALSYITKWISSVYV